MLTNLKLVPLILQYRRFFFVTGMDFVSGRDVALLDVCRRLVVVFGLARAIQ